jgi:2-aminoadipate transaminase
VGPENILLTTGSQQALDLIGKVFINPGDGILTERPTYLGALQAWNGHEPEYLSLDVDDDGLDTRDLDRALRSGPKFIYLLPNFQNPTGVTLSLERRKLLVERADHYGIPIIEDDPYGQLRYEGDHLPPLVILDALARGDNPYSGNVIYLSTFSKILVPGLRLGWVVAPAEVIRRLVVAKQGADLHTSSFAQMLAYEVARGGFLDEHVRKIRALYRTRRDAMLAAMKLYFPPEVQWTYPAGGLFLWVTLRHDWTPRNSFTSHLSSASPSCLARIFSPTHLRTTRFVSAFRTSSRRGSTRGFEGWPSSSSTCWIR